MTGKKGIVNDAGHLRHSLNLEKLMYGLYPFYRVRIDGREAAVITPKIKPEEHQINWVIYHTGAGETCDIIAGEGDTEKPPVIKMLLENGFLVCTITTGQQHWGAPSAEAAHEALYKYVKSTFPVRAKVNLLAQSMGGTSAYPWASAHPERISRIYGIYPVTNLESMGGRNPILNLKPLAEHNVRIMHRHGTEDKIVPFEQNAGRFGDTYRKFGGNIRIISVPGLGHQVNPLFFVPAEITGFFRGEL